VLASGIATTDRRHHPASTILSVSLLVVALIASVAYASVAPAAEAAVDDLLDDEERATIEWLIDRVAALPELRFVRNGRAYDAAAAARFLRGKWEANAADVTSVEAFIAVVATRSSTTGRPYLIRFPDGREVPSEIFFRALVTERSPP
jgi:hypothetical protein